jgi:hypothetical protein
MVVVSKQAPSEDRGAVYWHHTPEELNEGLGQFLIGEGQQPATNPVVDMVGPTFLELSPCTRHCNFLPGSNKSAKQCLAPF